MNELLKNQNCLCFNLKKTARAVTQVYEKELKKTGINATQFTLLAVLFHKQELAVSEFAKILVMDRTTISRNIKPLIRDGFVQTRSGKDKRVNLISLTNLGKTKVTKAQKNWKAAQTTMIQELGEGPLQALLGELQVITKKIDEL